MYVRTYANVIILIAEITENECKSYVIYDAKMHHFYLQDSLLVVFPEFFPKKLLLSLFDGELSITPLYLNLLRPFSGIFPFSFHLFRNLLQLLAMLQPYSL